MTTPALTFRVKQTTNGEFEIEVSPTQFNEPVEVPWNPPRMIGAPRHNNRDGGGPKFVV